MTDLERLLLSRYLPDAEKHAGRLHSDVVELVQPEASSFHILALHAEVVRLRGELEGRGIDFPHDAEVRAAIEAMPYPFPEPEENDTPVPATAEDIDWQERQEAYTRAEEEKRREVEKAVSSALHPHHGVQGVAGPVDSGLTAYEIEQGWKPAPTPSDAVTLDEALVMLELVVTTSASNEVMTTEYRRRALNLLRRVGRPV